MIENEDRQKILDAVSDAFKETEHDISEDRRAVFNATTALNTFHEKLQLKLTEIMPIIPEEDLFFY